MNIDYLKEYYDTVIQGKESFENLTKDEIRLIHDSLGFGQFQLHKQVTNLINNIQKLFKDLANDGRSRRN